MRKKIRELISGWCWLVLVLVSLGAAAAAAAALGSVCSRGTRRREQKLWREDASCCHWKDAAEAAVTKWHQPAIPFPAILTNSHQSFGKFQFDYFFHFFVFFNSRIQLKVNIFDNWIWNFDFWPNLDVSSKFIGQNWSFKMEGWGFFGILWSFCSSWLLSFVIICVGFVIWSFLCWCCHSLSRHVRPVGSCFTIRLLLQFLDSLGFFHIFFFSR